MNIDVLKFVAFLNKELPEHLEMNNVQTTYDPKTLKKLYTTVDLRFSVDLLHSFVVGEIDWCTFEQMTIHPILDYFTKSDLTFKFEDWSQGGYSDLSVVCVTFYNSQCSEFDVVIENVYYE